MSKQMTIEEVLNRAKQVEKTAESFYRIASKRFEGTEMQMLLIQLAEEEEGHQDDVEDIKNKYKSDLQLDSVVEIYGETQFLDKFEGIAQEGTIEAVANFALQMEHAAVESYQSLADNSSGQLKKVFQELADFERTHVSKVSRLIKDLDLDYEDEPEEFHAH